MVRKLTWRKAIEQVLARANGAMHYREIADQIISDGLVQTAGATPANTVSTELSNSLRMEGERSPFQKVGKGEYILRSMQGQTRQVGELSKSAGTNYSDSTEDQYEIITSFGMYWRRNLIEWSASPAILGVQQLGADPVNFSGQVGIYLLYDGREVIYVGRSTNRPLGRRLYEHTLDRLAARWDRFSWFGLCPVSDKGELGEPSQEHSSSKLVPALEAILIEALEPRQNRKRGDDLAAVEYLQQEDPEVARKKQRRLLEAALEKLEQQ